jgi:hypothetical protein
MVSVFPWTLGWERVSIIDRIAHIDHVAECKCVAPHGENFQYIARTQTFLVLCQVDGSHRGVCFLVINENELAIADRFRWAKLEIAHPAQKCGIKNSLTNMSSLSKN